MKFDAGHLIFYLGSFVVPTILVILNLVIRKVKGWKYTAGSDFLLTLMTISFSFAVFAKDISPHIRNKDLQASANAVFIVLGLLILVGWAWTVSDVEVAIHKSIRQNRDLTLMPQMKLYFAFALVVIFTGLELMIFLLT